MGSKYDVVVIGAGILGVTIAYWISKLTNHTVSIIDKEQDVAIHTTARNTGVVHRPFYLNPEKKRLFARASQKSYPLWAALAQQYRLPWSQVGTLEVALKEDQMSTLERYRGWALENGMKDSEIALLDCAQVKQIEPFVQCSGAIFSKTDTAVDFQKFSKAVFELAKKQGVTFIGNSKVTSCEENEDGVIVKLKTDAGDASEAETKFAINAAGGEAVDIAHSMGLAKEYTDLHFRGEYWLVDDAFGSKVSRNVYSVPSHREFPFLDPHFIVRANGRREVGPNAVLVSGPYAYSGLSSTRKEFIEKIFERPLSPKVKLFFNSQFLSLAWHEWRSSFSKKEMCERVRKFIPALSVGRLSERGQAGVRSSLIDHKGFVSEVVLIEGIRSLHILNYNSPGATGAPAFSAHVVGKLLEKGFLVRNREDGDASPLDWNYDEVSEP